MIAVILLLLAFLMGVLYFYPANIASIEPVACTDEAKICPDGSYVGRTGLNCEFTECPAIQTEEGTTAKLDQKISSKEISITPLEVVSDSRCPSDVQCVWAGEISVKVLLEKGSVRSEVTLKPQVPFVFEKNKILLTAVTPENNSKEPLTKADYRFTFLVTPLTVDTTGSISGHVTMSPICPVERIPREPQCEPKPYSTSIHIREEGKQKIVKTIQSESSGAFSTNLSPGLYELEAVTANGAILPKCTKMIVLVKPAENSIINISCDTGIR